MNKFCLALAAGLLFRCGLFQEAVAVETPLPEPLSLSTALTLATVSHPQLVPLERAVEMARAEQGVAESAERFQLELQGRLRWKRLQQGGASRDDHQWGLLGRQPLYDFGLNRAAEESASAEVERRQLVLQAALEQQRLAIMEQFFAVLLADHRRMVADEEMTIAYLRHQKRVDKEITGDYSELDLLAGESHYRDALARQKRVEGKQRLERIRLAALLDRPTQLPTTLIAPTTTPEEVFATMPSLDQLQQRAEERSPRLVQLRQGITVARHRLRWAQLQGRPQLDVELEWLDNSLVTTTRDRWRAGLVLEVPLVDGGARAAKMARAQYELEQLEAELEQERQQLSQEVTALYLELQTLQWQWQADLLATDYREVDLERNRARYEQELQANLGDALVEISRGHLRRAESRFQALLIRARLQWMQGEEITVDE